MHPNLKMHLLKQAINKAIRILNLFAPSPKEPQYTTSKILERVFTSLFQAYRVQNEYVDVYQDRNFGELLNFTYKALSYLSENDRYYRMWLAFLFFQIHDELRAEMDLLSLAEVQKETETQWELGFLNAVTPRHFNNNRRELIEMMMANTLPNMKNCFEKQLKTARKSVEEAKT